MPEESEKQHENLSEIYTRDYYAIGKNSEETIKATAKSLETLIAENGEHKYLYKVHLIAYIEWSGNASKK